MTPSNLREQLYRDEGCVLHAYRDSLGYLTIGVGRLIDERRGGGITRGEAMMLLDHDIDEKRGEVSAALPWLSGVDPVRQAVFVNMAFQLGTAGLLQFRNTLTRARRHDWPGVAAGMMDSLWATQTPNRAERLREQILTGRWQ